VEEEEEDEDDEEVEREDLLSDAEDADHPPSLPPVLPAFPAPPALLPLPLLPRRCGKEVGPKAIPTRVRPITATTAKIRAPDGMTGLGGLQPRKR
jgi:hypothetical protein